MDKLLWFDFGANVIFVPFPYLIILIQLLDGIWGFFHSKRTCTVLVVKYIRNMRVQILTLSITLKL